jgi:glutathione S-transferase
MVLVTFDWVPEIPRGYVRDLRVRWALEEANLPYRIETVPFKSRNAEHFSSQPFGQVPWLRDGEISLFESGAIMLHVAERSEILMPRHAEERAGVINWLFAALNSVEMATLPYSIFKFTGDEEQTAGRQALDAFLQSRLQHMEAYLSRRTWLVDTFSIADILMADVLRLVVRFDGLAEYPLCRAYVERATTRPSFAKVHADQLAHFAAAD